MSVAMAAPAAGAAAKKAATKVAAAAPGVSKGKGDLPGRGDWRQRARETGGGGGKAKSGGGSKLLAGSAGKWRRMMIAEFIVCVVLLGLSPLAKGADEMGPARFMKRGSATCALFIVLGLISSAGTGAAKASSMFGALVTLVLLVDQREAFGKLATILNASDEESAARDSAAKGPDDSTAVGDDPGVIDA